MRWTLVSGEWIIYFFSSFLHGTWWHLDVIITDKLSPFHLMVTFFPLLVCWYHNPPHVPALILLFAPMKFKILINSNSAVFWGMGCSPPPQWAYWESNSIDWFFRGFKKKICSIHTGIMNLCNWFDVVITCLKGQEDNTRNMCEIVAFNGNMVLFWWQSIEFRTSCLNSTASA